MFYIVSHNGFSRNERRSGNLNRGLRAYMPISYSSTRVDTSHNGRKRMEVVGGVFKKNKQEKRKKR